jgi:rRNA maturation protein Nop10
MSEKVLEMTLPSYGLMYDGAIPGGTVPYSPMTGKEEMLLAGGRGSVLDGILSACLSLPVGFKPSDLLVSDRFFAMLILRSVSYGEDYTFKVQCEDCDSKFKHTVRIPGDFDVKVLSEGVTEPFLVELPHSKKVVSFRLLRGTDELSIQKHTDREFQQNKKVEGDPAYIFRLAKHIVAIDDEEVKDIRKAMTFVESLIGKDSVAFRNAIDEVDFGIDTTLKFECPRCGEENETVMPLNSEFFRPRA